MDDDSPLKEYKLSEEEFRDGLGMFEELGIIRKVSGNRYLLTDTGEQFLAIIGCGKSKFSKLCFRLFDSLVKSGKLNCRYNLKDKSYYFKPKQV
jgi:hypothetical protein